MKRLLLLSGGLLACVFALLLFVLFTTTGLKLLLGFSPDNFSAMVSRGDLARGFSLKTVRFETDGLSMEMGEFEIAWQLPELLNRQLNIQRLLLRDVTLYIKEKSEPAPATELNLSMPVDLDLKIIELRGLEVYLPGVDEPQTISQISAGLRSEGQRLYIERLDITADQYAITSRGHVDLLQIPAGQLTIEWSYEEPHLGLLQGRTELAGDLNRITVLANLQSPSVIDIEASIEDLAGTPTWQGALTAAGVNTGLLTGTLLEHELALVINGSGTLDNAVLKGSLISTGNSPQGVSALSNSEAGYLIENINLNFNLDASFPGASSPALNATLNWQNGKIAAIDSSGPRLALTAGELQLDYSNDTYLMSGRSGFLLNDEINGTIEATGSGDLESIRLDNFTLTLEQGVLKGDFAASMDVDATRVDSNIDWNRLRIPVNNEQELFLSDGKLVLNGELDDYTLTLDTAIGIDDIGPFQLSLSASGGQDSIAIEPVSIKLGTGLLSGRASAQWLTELAIDLELAGQGINPDSFVTGWPGDLAINANVSATQSSDSYEIKISRLDITGPLRGYPINLQLESVIDEQGINFEHASLASGSSSMQLTGQWGDVKDINWVVNSPDLGNIYRDMQGQLEAAGHFSGSLEQPQLTGNLRSSGIRSPWIDIDTVDSTFRVSNGLDIQLNLTNLVRDDLVINTLKLAADGQLAQHEYSLNAESSLADLSLGGTGVYNGSGWTTQVEQMLITHKTQNWKLDSPFGLALSDAGITLDRLCLLEGITSICSSGGWQTSGEWSAAILATGISYELLNPYLPPEVKASGNATINLNLYQLVSEDIRGDAQIASDTGSIRFQIDDDLDQEFTLESLNGQMVLEDRILDGQLTIQSANSELPPLEASLRLTPVDITAPDYAAMTVDGAFKWQVNDLSFISNLLPQVADVQGKLVADLNVGGYLSEPRLDGKLLIDEASMMIPEFGIELLGIHVSGHSSSTNTFALEGQAGSGAGSIGLNAEIITGPSAGQLITSTIKGERFELINTPEVRAMANTDLILELDREHTRLNGSVGIENALIDLDEIRQTATLSNDVVMLDKQSNDKQPMRTDIRLNIRLRDNIQIKGQGISGRLTGDLEVFSTKEREMLGNGEVSIIDGRYAAYGQDLIIEEGKVIYSNQRLDNPELRVTAVRRVGDISAGLNITGFLSSPQVTLISTPSMRDEEILSYIVFGRPLSSLTSGEGTNLIGAATALGIKNSGFITKSLSSTFGIDQFELNTDPDGQNASLTIGKYITPRIYISYVIGLLESFSTANIRYDMTDKWSLEAKSSAESVGVDVFYSIEK